MFTYTSDYQPYMKDGRVFLPEKTIALLIEKGLDPKVGASVRQGMTLAEVINLDDLHRTFEQIVTRLGQNQFERNTPALI